ncbi:NlpC/P60 family protein [Clostridium pasteurianum DSM 525 = ATCC 6013]|uniref:NLP/P60 protein n=1 Tax=Clostridium pasteurianum DSM 525 = ATCC 6013 TaxID=1262449 RepID=A0A0H3J4A7_CLOPA|nr:C40 family peptidase [Clostridium pasteurianum]AJA46748.1 NlpC/P60 family protein [Clostridium pasteurianum DSM 525 = ATCC 6013]AJA50736.1 NlpC/P60 family protein [Clostridium pasteurianum DSM 525 = ATCC 6013]AOZ74144.1 cell-wall hydrolase [Clostridium pasteurianum DSM 525 = ATCC 6013]AOZ77941.1 cell-wall hydrolase [Clostridium pasteurianum]ELP58642.1 Protein containing cell-wall hydrolase domain [Clostridium pasteurianum DSM 525 = ATCC 6013]
MNKKPIILLLAVAVSIGLILPAKYTYAATSHKTVISKSKSKPSPNLKSMTCIDTPRSGSFLNKNTLIGGWALNKSGVKEVQILVDGKFKGRAKIGISRQDVARVYPAYKNKNSGYNYILDYRSIGQGTHTITVKAIGKNNTSNTNSIKVNVNKLAPIVWIDTPTSGTNINKNFNVAGWALNGSGVKQVQVYVDNRLIGNAVIRKYRPDVARVFPKYNNRNSGYSLTISKDKIPSGNHTITVKVKGNDGVITSKSVKIKKAAPVSTKSSANKGQAVVNYAEKFKGIKYVWGGETPKGFDCSGYTKYVYNYFNIKLPHNAAQQYKYGKYVSKNSLKPGDLVFFGKTAGSIYHVGIYIGSGNYINEPKPGDKVKITVLRYMPDYYGAKRLISQ